MSGVLNSYNCKHLGLKEGSSFQDMRDAVSQMDDRGSGYDRKKDGKNIWVAPYKKDPKLILNPNIEVYEVLTLEELSNYKFDATAEYYELK